MAQSAQIPWGTGEINIALPSEWRLLGVLKPNSPGAPVDPGEACRKALADPAGCPTLKSRNLKGRRIVIVVDDHSRPTPVALFIKPVLDELSAAGVDFRDIRILVATGVHRASRPDEVLAKLGPDVGDRYQWQCHDAYDPEHLTFLGRTRRGTPVSLNSLLVDADLIVCLGAIEPHLLLGFGGGLKMIIPGCASAETIGRNHLQGVDPDHFDYVGTSADDSPMRLDLEEGAVMLGKEFFIVNAAMDDFGRPVAFFCGHPIDAHRRGEAFVRETAGLRVSEQADVVLANSFPMDNDLRQSIKCVGNSLYAAKPGGVLLGCLRCLEGLGEIPLAPRTLPYPIMKTLLSVVGKKRILPLVKRVKRNEPVEEVFIGHFGLQMMRRNHLGLFSDSPLLPDNVGRKIGMARSFTRLEAMMNWAAGIVPKKASVWILPHGGASFVHNDIVP